MCNPSKPENENVGAVRWDMPAGADGCCGTCAIAGLDFRAAGLLLRLLDVGLVLLLRHMRLLML